MNTALNTRAFIYDEPQPIQEEQEVPSNLRVVPDPPPASLEKRPAAPHPIDLEALAEGAGDPMPPFREKRSDKERSISIAALDEGAGEPASPGERAVFNFLRADQLGGVSEAMDFVEGLLTDGGASVLYGPSNCGKSFWIVDLGVSVATGRAFRDEMEVDQGAVIYVALEGSHGAKNRMAALRQTGKLKADTPFYLIFDPLSLLEVGHAKRLAETVAAVAVESGHSVKLVIIDTMARAMAGGDENSGKDMTEAVKAIDAVRAATGAHVCVVHHCGKDQAKGARGHSSLRAAVDTEIEVSRPEDETISTVRVTKQRDLSPGEPMPFSLKVVELGTDRRGKPITSCVVFHEDAIMASKKGKTGRPQTTNVPHLLSMLPQPSTTAWAKFARSAHDVTATPFYNTLTEIKRLKAATYTKKGGWTLPEPNFGSEFSA